MTMWQRGEYQGLVVEDTLRTMKSSPSKARQRRYCPRTRAWGSCNVFQRYHPKFDRSSQTHWSPSLQNFQQYWYQWNGRSSSTETSSTSRSGERAKELRQVVAKFARWMANTRPLWATYRAFMWNRLVALGKKNPDIRHIGIGDIWRRFLAKCILAVAGPSTKDACGSDQTNYAPVYLQILKALSTTCHNFGRNHQKP